MLIYKNPLNSSALKADPTLDKFIKAIATGNYLANNNEVEAMESIVKYAPLNFLQRPIMEVRKLIFGTTNRFKGLLPNLFQK